MSDMGGGAGAVGMEGRGLGGVYMPGNSGVGGMFGGGGGGFGDVGGGGGGASWLTWLGSYGLTYGLTYGLYGTVIG